MGRNKNKMTFSSIWLRLTEWFSSVGSFISSLFRSQPVIEKDLEAVKSQIIEETVPGEIEELPPVVDESDVKVDIEDEQQKPILDLENVEIQESVEIFEEKLSHNDIAEEILENWDSNYSLDFEDDNSIDSEDEKENILEIESSKNKSQIFNDYIEFVIHTNEVVQSVQLELDSEKFKEPIKLKSFKSTDRLQQWSTDLSSSDYNFENLKILIDGSQVQRNQIEKIKQDNQTVQFSI